MEQKASCPYCAGAGELTCAVNNQQRERYYLALGQDPGEPLLPEDTHYLVQCYFCSLRDSIPQALAEFEVAEIGS